MVALLFLTRGPMPLEPVWREFLSAAALLEPMPNANTGALTYNPAVLQQQRRQLQRHRRHTEQQTADVIAAQHLFSVYLHTPPGHAFPPTSIFAGYEIADRVQVQWAQWSVAEAERRLLAAALLQPANQRFMLLSEACLPLYPPHVVWAEALAARLSRVHACKRDTPEDEQRRNIDKWEPSMETDLLQRRNWRKSNQWFLLTRKHAQVISSDIHVAEVFQRECFTYDPLNPSFAIPQQSGASANETRKCVADEHYVPTVLAVHGLDNETDCQGQNTHAEWRTGEWSPHSYTPEEVPRQIMWQRMVWFSKQQWCPAQAAVRSADAIFRRRGSRKSLAEVRKASGGSAVHYRAYQPLGPLCSIMARKFGGETVDAVLRSGANCAGGYGWSTECFQ